MQGNFKGPPRSSEVQVAQRFLMPEFLMKSEHQGSDLMFYKIGDAQTRELWRGEGRGVGVGWGWGLERGGGCGGRGGVWR